MITIKNSVEEYNLITAHVNVTEEFDEEAGHFKYTFRWDGPADGVIMISGELIRQNPELFSKLPWKLTKIAENKRGDEWWKRVDSEE